MILILGLDGATFDLLNPWFAQGHLPHLARLKNQGSAGVLQSTLPPVTPAAWASFLTGKHPHHHGVRDFFAGRAGEYRMISGNDIRGQTVWEILSGYGKTVGVVNVPVTYPPREVNGFLVPGLPTPDERDTYPAGLLTPYEHELGPYTPFPKVVYQAGKEEAFIADLWVGLESHKRYTLRLAAEHPADVFMVQFQTPDMAQHALWKHLDPTHPWHDPALARRYGNVLREMYQHMDTTVGELLTLCDPEAVFVLSDHGFGPMHRIVNLNLFLIQAGLMTLKQEVRVRTRAWAFQKGLGTVASKILRRVGVRWDGKMLDYADVDWGRTTAYAMGHLGQIYLNLAGREPQGIIHPERYAETLGAVTRALRGLEKWMQVETFPGEDPTTGPDLHVVLDGYRSPAYPLFATDGKIVSEKRFFLSGEHRREGILMVAGEGIRRGMEMEGARIVDVVPTLLARLGLPVPADMDGRVLDAILDEAFELAISPVSSRSTAPHNAPLSGSEQTAIETRLRGLGYLGGAHD